MPWWRRSRTTRRRGCSRRGRRCRRRRSWCWCTWWPKGRRRCRSAGNWKEPGARSRCGRWRRRCRLRSVRCPSRCRTSSRWRSARSGWFRRWRWSGRSRYARRSSRNHVVDGGEVPGRHVLHQVGAAAGAGRDVNAELRPESGTRLRPWWKRPRTWCWLRAASGPIACRTSPGRYPYAKGEAGSCAGP